MAKHRRASITGKGRDADRAGAHPADRHDRGLFIGGLFRAYWSR